MPNKSSPISISSSHIDSIPKKSFGKYKVWVVNDKLSPSAALHKFMTENQCPNPDSSIIIRLIEFTLPEVDISRNSFTFKIHDSGYPTIEEELSDNGFDALVEEMRTLPSVL